MHPIDHISTALVYLVDPNKISGALYHLVATYSVIIGMLPSSSESATDLILLVRQIIITLLSQSQLI